MATSAAYIDLNEGAAPAAPGTGKVRVYAKTDGNAYQKDDAGTETGLASSGSSVFSGAQVTRITSDQAIASNTVTAVQWNGENYDTDTYHDNSTNNTLLTIPANGKYRIDLLLRMNSVDATDRQVRLHKNGNLHRILWQENVGTSLTTEQICVTSVEDLAAGDDLEIVVYQAAGAFNILVEFTSTVLSITKIG